MRYADAQNDKAGRMMKAESSATEQCSTRDGGNPADYSSRFG